MPGDFFVRSSGSDVAEHFEFAWGQSAKQHFFAVRIAVGRVSRFITQELGHYFLQRRGSSDIPEGTHPHFPKEPGKALDGRTMSTPYHVANYDFRLAPAKAA